MDEQTDYGSDETCDTKDNAHMLRLQTQFDKPQVKNISNSSDDRINKAGTYKKRQRTSGDDPADCCPKVFFFCQRIVLYGWLGKQASQRKQYQISNYASYERQAFVYGVKKRHRGYEYRICH